MQFLIATSGTASASGQRVRFVPFQSFSGPNPQIQLHFTVNPLLGDCMQSPRGHAPELCSPFVKIRDAYSMLATKLRYRHTTFSLLQYPPSCRLFPSPAGQRMICVSLYLLFFIQNLLSQYAKKILPVKTTDFPGDYLMNPVGRAFWPWGSALMRSQVAGWWGCKFQEIDCMINF